MQQHCINQFEYPITHTKKQTYAKKRKPPGTLEGAKRLKAFKGLLKYCALFEFWSKKSKERCQSKRFKDFTHHIKILDLKILEV